jgi:hypothetical protein
VTVSALFPVSYYRVSHGAQVAHSHGFVCLPASVARPLVLVARAGEMFDEIPAPQRVSSKLDAARDQSRHVGWASLERVGGVVVEGY